MVTSIPIKNIDEIELIKDLYRKKNQLQELLMFMLAINTGLGVLDLLNLKVKDIKGKHYLYKDISYLMWLFNQHSVNIAFKFIDVDENMNLRFREGVCL